MTDKGPWRATTLYVGSDDFERDVSLEINGDFDIGERDKYAEWLAKELNDCPVLRTDLARAKELLQEMADAVKEDPDYDDLHYKATAFLNRRSYPLTPKG